MASVSTDHEALLADLRIIADTVLDRVETLVHQVAASPGAAAADTTAADGADAVPPAGDGCTWCPLCAIAALVRGENHELLTRLATQIAALIAWIRDLLARVLPQPDPAPDPSTPDRADQAASAPGFVPISVTIRQ